jgi:hypothetical protein
MFGFLICLILWMNLSRPAIIVGSIRMSPASFMAYGKPGGSANRCPLKFPQKSRHTRPQKNLDDLKFYAHTYTDANFATQLRSLCIDGGPFDKTFAITVDGEIDLRFIPTQSAFFSVTYRR